MMKVKYIIFLLNFFILIFLLSNLFSTILPSGYDYANHFYFTKYISEGLKEFYIPLWSKDWYLGFPILSTPIFSYILTGYLFLLFPSNDFLIFNMFNIFMFLMTPLVLYWTTRKLDFNEVESSLTSLIFVITPAFTRINIFGQFTTLFSLPFLLILIASFYRLLIKSEKKYFLISLFSITIIAITHLLTLLTAIIYISIIFLYKLLFEKKQLRKSFFYFIYVLLIPFLLSLPFLYNMIMNSNFLANQKIIIHPTRELIFNSSIFRDWVLRPLGTFQLVFAFTLLGMFLRSKFKRPILLDVSYFILILILFVGVQISFYELILSFLLMIFYSFSVVKIKITRKIMLFLTLFFLLFLFSLGPNAGLASILPFSQWLVFDRFLLHASIFGSIISAFILYKTFKFFAKQKIKLLPLILIIILLSYVSFNFLHGNFKKYLEIQEEIPSPIVKYFKDDKSFGRILFLNCPSSWIEVSPSILEKSTVDGGYNTARLLPALRNSGIEKLNDISYHENFDIVNHFLNKSEDYGIKWVVGCDIKNYKNLFVNDYKLDYAFDDVEILKNTKNVTFLEYPDYVKVNYNRTNDKINLEITSKKDFSIIIKEAYHPNWVATYEGKRVKIDRTNTGLMELNLPAGRKSVELKFDSSLSRILILASVIYIVSFLISIIFLKKGRNKW